MYAQQAEAVFDKILGPRNKKYPWVNKYGSRIPKMYYMKS